MVDGAAVSHCTFCFLKKRNMGGGSLPLPLKNDQLSTKHRHGSVNGRLYELADFHSKDITPSDSENDKCASRNSDSQSPEILSTSDLISAVSYAWGRARQPLSDLLSKSSSKCGNEVIHGVEALQYKINSGTVCTSISSVDQACSDYLTSTATSSASREPSNLYCSQPSYGSISFWRTLHERSKVIDKSSLQNCLFAKRLPLNLGSSYTWMTMVDCTKPKNEVIGIGVDNKTSTSDHCNHWTSSFENSSMDISCNSEGAQHVDIPHGHGETASFDSNKCTATCSEYDTVRLHNIEVIDCEASSSISETERESVISISDANSQEDTFLVSVNHEDSESSIKEVDKQMPFFQADNCGSKIGLSDKPHYAFAKHEHAFAGAMAGICVSLCLHPMDTIKTVIQSCRAEQKPLHYVGRSIVSERGLTGLYRGISSNLVTSAPISAVYTFTYESVKKTLLPLLPKENHSFAHCMAGGCASVATSFIFTPSERIKQQMQVGSHYRNCWNALKEVLQRGGLPSLYTGWGAVLCRNVPHSVIKFYTYESLKQIMLPSMQSSAQPNTLTTLFCGGLAGSMASLFTTPFDVVKTRMQTQIPGSMTQYVGVFNTLTNIGKTEGLKGLYRGLTPRLVMYMVQGALFFASYESFKRFFSLDVQLLND